MRAGSQPPFAIQHADLSTLCRTVARAVSGRRPEMPACGRLVRRGSLRYGRCMLNSARFALKRHIQAQGMITMTDKTRMSGSPELDSRWRSSVDAHGFRLRLLRLAEVLQLTSLSKTTIYEW